MKVSFQIIWKLWNFDKYAANKIPILLLKKIIKNVLGNLFKLQYYFCIENNIFEKIKITPATLRNRTLWIFLSKMTSSNNKPPQVPWLMRHSFIITYIKYRKHTDAFLIESARNIHFHLFRNVYLVIYLYIYS